MFSFKVLTMISKRGTLKFLSVFLFCFLLFSVRQLTSQPRQKRADEVKVFGNIANGLDSSDFTFSLLYWHKRHFSKCLFTKQISLCQ